MTGAGAALAAFSWERLLGVSVPNLAGIFICIALFCRLFPARRPAWVIVAVDVAACGALALGSAAVAQLLRPFFASLGLSVIGQDAATSLYFTVVLLICLALARALYEMSGWDSVFCCTAGYALQNLGHSAYDMLLTLLPFDLPVIASGALLLVLICAICAVAWKTFVRHIRTRHLEGSGDARTALVLVGVIAVNIFLSTSVNTVRDSGVAWGTYASLRFTQLVVSVLMLFLDYEILYSNHMRVEVAANQQLMEDERRQYELSAETIEAINVRCHDIRHQVRRLGSEGAGGKEFLSEIDGLISVYDSSVKTGNRALDVILTEKTVLAQARGVQLTCVADGSVLGFMEEQDVYSLFGNALDNALDAAEKVDDPDRRLVDLNVRRMAQMACVQVRNYYSVAPQEAEGGEGLRTTKTDGGLHGYGTKSMRLVAERYGGNISYTAEGGLFRLTVLFPIPS